MKAIDALYRSGVAIEPHRTVGEAAQVMETAGVGSLAVIDGDVLVGIVTDRDLVRRGLAKGVPSDARIDALMSTPVVTIDAEADLETAFATFRDHGLRRIPVMRSGRFVGMLVLDDLLLVVSNHLDSLVKPIIAEAMFAHRDVSVPAQV